MKKMLKNNKGFTLIELLAVIVVLAVIMIIATQQVNGTIKRSRANSFVDSVLAIKKAAQLECAENNSVKAADLKKRIEHAGIEIKDVSGSTNTIEISLSADSKYENMDESLVTDSATGGTVTPSSETEKLKVTLSNLCD